MLTLASGGDGLPRSYLVRQSKNHLNELIHIARTPRTAVGENWSVLLVFCKPGLSLNWYNQGNSNDNDDDDNDDDG